VEVAIVGSLPPALAAPPPYLVVGGFRIVELVALALCDAGKVVVYVEEAVDLPLILEGCRFEIRNGVPPDVPRIHVGCAPYLLKSKSLVCGEHSADFGGSRLVVEPLASLADAIERNVEFMSLALARLRELGVELVRGDVRGIARGSVYVRGRVYEYAVVEGPAVIGPESAALPLTHVRPSTALYYNSRVRGEVKNALLDAYTRKQHSGYLGDSYVSPFVNLGAGTTVSNLKNTLGPVRPSYSQRAYRKLGAIFGDFAKTAIGTLIYCGKYIGPLSHVYGLVDRDVPPLSIYKNGVIVPMDRDRAREYVRRDLERFGRGDLFEYYTSRLLGGRLSPAG
jgi:NDP-sugar pyrophosphorylase family protein